VGTGDAVVAEGTAGARGRGRPAARSGSGRSPDGSDGRPSAVRSASAGPGARAAAIGAAVAAGGTLLFLGYLRVSWTVAATSDGASQALQARDMLAGNWLLHGWTLSDVSFYATELPEYVLVEAIRPFGLGVIHVAAAATYTMLVLAVFALARGHAGGRDGILRGALAAVIMLAPQLGYGAFVLLLSPDHVGTQVPLLAGWLLLDLAPRRWWVPTVLCLLLALVQLADRVAVLTAVLPLIVVCGVAAARRRPRKPEVGVVHRAGGRAGRRAGGLAGRWALACWFELALITAGLLSVGVAWVTARLLAAAGGFAGHPFPLTLAPLSQLWTHTWLTGWGILELYGANFIGVAGWAGPAFAALHLIGLALAIAAAAVALSRFLRPSAGQRLGAVAPNAKRAVGRCGPPRQTGGWEPGLVDAVLAVAIVANLLSYLLSTAPGTVLGTGYDAREIAAVLPLGAVLAGRVFGVVLAGPCCRPPWAADRGGAEGTVRSRTWVFMGFVLPVMLAGYASAFGYSAAQAARTGQESALASWLVAHGLRYGLGETSANVVTVDSGGRVELMPVAVRGGRVRPLLYQSSTAAYDPGLHDANFLVSRVPAAQAGQSAQSLPYSTVRATFGPTARSYRFDGYTVLLWDVNLLTRIGELGGASALKRRECIEAHILEAPADAAS
jgi:hypothetical protein